mmetsp:Transcript_37321/g.79278  ORF Transcript_37321/g.79278 Transcript_37321/m.79278 type:complete len:363 (+) Transcript_37321:81-1169(+)
MSARPSGLPTAGQRCSSSMLPFLALYLLALPAAAVRSPHGDDTENSSGHVEASLDAFWPGGNAAPAVVERDSTLGRIAAEGNATATAAAKEILSQLPNMAIAEDLARSLAQFLGVVEGAPCSQNSQVPYHGCKIGCRCSALQRCYPKLYKHPSRKGPADGQEVGVCDFLVPPFLASLLLVSLLVAAGLSLAICFKMTSGSTSQCVGDARKLGLKRMDLEARIKAATGLDAEQRRAILDRFCGADAAVVAKENLQSGSDEVVEEEIEALRAAASACAAKQDCTGLDAEQRRAIMDRFCGADAAVVAKENLESESDKVLKEEIEALRAAASACAAKQASKAAVSTAAKLAAQARIVRSANEDSS